MAILKCKMCGGDLNVAEGMSVCECDYCGTKQTVPKTNDDVVANLFNRANNLRLKCEFDKAAAIYEKIVEQNDGDAEAHWGIVLCKYGIEYVEDPKTNKRIPTCHRTLFEAVTTDADYLAAIDYSDAVQQAIYESEARAIDKIQKDILTIVKNEKPFDVFICYKETDENGKRTIDSTIANDIYYQLTQEGFKVFYAAITLEDKLGQEYEPYIFAALNSAKVMLALGTKPEYINAVWVKNEWSRFLKLMKTDRNKLLIPCYRDMDAYDLPEEFAHLQAQDMSKIGFINDVVRGIKKLINTEDVAPKTVVKETVVSSGSTNTAPLLKRAFMFLEDGDWRSANEYAEKVLDIDPENAEAYLVKLMADFKAKKREDLKNVIVSFENTNICQKVFRFADEKLKAELKGYIDFIIDRNLSGSYNKALEIMQKAKTETEFNNAAKAFTKIGDYKDSPSRAKECYEKAEEIKRRAETETQTCNMLFIEYKKALKSEKNGINKKKEADKQLSLLNEQLSSFTNLKNCWQNIDNCLVTLSEKLKSIQTEISSLNNKRAELGFFAGKQKREITDKINTLETEKNNIAQDIALKQREKFGYKTIDEVNCAIQSVVQKIEAQKKEIKELSIVRSSNSIRDELNSFDFGKELLRKLDSLVNAKKGNYITFGKYKQGNSKSAKESDVEWLVLDVNSERALVISKYALKCGAFTYTYTNNKWENSHLRKWLNEEFINSAFSIDEKSMIPTVTVSADHYSCGSTKDRVFLLSVTEANKYFSSNMEKQCKATKYATEYNSDYCQWWLRTPGRVENMVSFISTDGSLSGTYGDRDTIGIRPAMWIDLSKIQ